MYIVLYEIKVKAGCDSDFAISWKILTDAIKKHCGSLGSRLHKTELDDIYIAYAQWPDRETFENPPGLNNFTPDQKNAREVMKEATEYFKPVYKAVVFDDRLVK